VSLERCWSGKNFGVLIVSFIVFKIYFNIYMDTIYTIIQQTIFVQYTKTTLQTFMSVTDVYHNRDKTNDCNTGPK